MSTEIVRTAFDRVQRQLGCEFMDWEGWYWPNHFGDPIAEHRAVREDAGVWDESPLRKWELRGKDALRAADRIFTNDMLGLEVGQVRYGPFCDENGKMVGDGTVLRFAEDFCVLVTALDSDLDHIQHETDPFDMSLDKVIRLDTEDFQGKQALVETAKALPRRLVTLAVEESEAPEYGAAVTVDGEPIGTLTSPCESPTLGRVIGLAVLETRFADPGTRVDVALGDGTVPATVATLPIYDPEKRRPRS